MSLLDNVWEPIAETKNHPKRIDYEYERCGTASIFMFTEPLSGRRQTHIRKRRTKFDWAEEVRWLAEQYPQTKKITLVCDNLKTHGYGTFYERHRPEEALSICQRLEIRYTSKHGSRLNIAESE